MNDYGLGELHQKILEIAIYIDELCKKNNIKYYLSGGCALGAIRHKGFIPWDDDLDIFMTSENYYKFMEICEKHLDMERFYLQKENTEEWPLCFSKLRMNGTTYIETYNEKLEMHKGIYIDIYRLDNISNSSLLGYFQFLCSKLLIARLLPRINYTADSIMKKVLIGVMKKLPEQTDDFLLKQVKKFNTKKCDRVANLFHRGSFKSNIYPIKWLGSPRYVSFENMELPVPERAEKYLSTRFGNDYMVIPEKDKRKICAHAKYFDVETSYKDFKIKKSALPQGKMEV